MGKNTRQEVTRKKSELGDEAVWRQKKGRKMWLLVLVMGGPACLADWGKLANCAWHMVPLAG